MLQKLHFWTFVSLLNGSFDLTIFIFHLICEHSYKWDFVYPNSWRLAVLHTNLYSIHMKTRVFIHTQEQLSFLISYLYCKILEARPAFLTCVWTVLGLLGTTTIQIIHNNCICCSLFVILLFLKFRSSTKKGQLKNHMSWMTK